MKVGRNEIPNEVWKYGGKEIKNWAICRNWEVWKVLRGRKIRKGKGLSEEWKKGIIIPILKKDKRR